MKSLTFSCFIYALRKLDLRGLERTTKSCSKHHTLVAVFEHNQDRSSNSGQYRAQRMPPPRYCFRLLFSDLIDRLLFKTHQKFKMAESARRVLGECSDLSDL